MPPQSLHSASDLEAFLRQQGLAALPGLNVQEPWASLLMSGRKTIETRTYACPAGFVGVPVGLVATQRENGEKAALVGVVRIEGCQRYESVAAFRADEAKHCVGAGSSYDWADPTTPKWGWTMTILATCTPPIPIEGRRGIVWTRELQWG